MIRSMTGFGRGEVERDGRALSAEIRTVNHKFCEVSVRLPRSLSSLENRARLKVQEALTRGKVNVNINWKDGRDRRTDTGPRDRAEDVRDRREDVRDRREDRRDRREDGRDLEGAEGQQSR
mgnify:CR=1 FL=1